MCAKNLADTADGLDPAANRRPNSLERRLT